MSDSLFFIALGSASFLKLHAVRQACRDPDLRQILPSVDVLDTDISSGVPDQPIGIEQALLGARNRADGALQAHPNARLAIGIESFVTSTVLLGQTHIMDLAVILVLDRKGRQVFTTGVSMEMPRDTLDHLFQGGGVK